MKRNAFNVIMSILLILAALAALCAAGWGGFEVYALKKLEKELPSTADTVSELEDAVNLVAENEEKYFDGVEICYEGDDKLLEGRLKISDGKAQLEEGRAALYEAQAAYDEAQAQLQVGRDALNEAQMKMEEARPEYEEGKAQLESLELLLPMLQLYNSFQSGVLMEIPGFSDANSWYRLTVVPYAAGLGINLPHDLDKFAEAMEQQLAEGNAKLAEFEAAEAKLYEAQAVIDEADAQLYEAKLVLDGKARDLDSAANELKASENKLGYAAQQLEDGKASLAEFEDAVGQLEDGVVLLMKTGPVCDRKDNIAVEGVPARLGTGFDIYKYNEDGELLCFPEGGPRLDYDKCLKVCDAYRGYVKDYTDDVAREAVVRTILAAALLVSAVFAIVSAAKALRGKAKAVPMSVILAVFLLACNAAGLILGYAHFTHPQGEDAYSGLLPLGGYILLTAVSLLFAAACLRGRKKYKLTEENAVSEAAEAASSEPENKETGKSEYEEIKKEYEAALSNFIEARSKYKGE